VRDVGGNNQLSHALKIVHASAGHLLQELEDNCRKPGKPMRLGGAFKVWNTNTTEYCQWQDYCKYMTRNGLHKKIHLNGTANTVFAILSLQIQVVTKCDFDEGVNIWDLKLSYL
jgi:hypothetical protein